MSKANQNSTRRRRRIVGLGLTTLTAGAFLYNKLSNQAAKPLPPALVSARKRFTSSKAGGLHYYVDDRGEGRPVVLIHSINAAASAYEMKPLFEHFQEKRPVYALELPGFGFSERGDRVYSPALYMAAIEDFMSNEVGIAADVIALSLGCEFAAGVAKELPGLFNTLTLISPTGLGDKPIDFPDFIFPVASFSPLRQPLFDLLASKPSVRYYLGQSFVGEPPDDFIEYAHIAAQQPGAVYAPIYFLGGKLFTSDIRPAVYEQLSVPTLILYDKDPNINFDGLPTLLDNNKQVQIERISPSRGLPHWEFPAETLDALERFWTG